jgi:pimeloyl-ACP methyl ester carboxylesterase
MEKFVTAGGCALRIEDSGELPAEGAHVQPVIALLHGYLESLDIWDDFSKLLRKAGMRVIAIDLPGHGVSEVKGEVHTMEFLANTLHAVLELQGVAHCFVAGHSMGGYAALEFLRKYREMTDGIILMHSTPNPDSEEKRADREREIEIIRAGRKELLSAAPAKGFAAENRKRFADEIDMLKLQIMLTEDDGIVALLRGMMERRDNNEMLATAGVPTLMIFGEHDEHISRETAETIIARHPEAEVVWLAHSGHNGFIEEAERTAEVIIDFCDRNIKE